MSLFLSELATAISSALLPFFGVGIAVGLLSAFALYFVPREASHLRYLIATSGLLLLPLAFAGVVLHVWRDGATLGLAPWTAAHSYSVESWIFDLWLLGMGFFAIRSFRKFFNARRIRRSGMQLANPIPVALFEELKRELAVSRSVRLLESSLIYTPMVLGWLFPVVLVPAGMMAALSREEIRAILCHELAHIKRFDPFVNLIQEWIEVVLFFHPVTWWLSSQIRKEREFCCDEIAARVTGNPIALARSLTVLESCRRVCPPGLAANGGSLYARISRLLQRGENTDPVSPGRRKKWIGIGIGFVLIAAVLILAGQSKVRTVERIVSGIPRSEIPAAPDWVLNEDGDQIWITSRFVESEDGTGNVEVERSYPADQNVRIATRFLEVPKGTLGSDLSKPLLLSESEVQKLVRRLSHETSVDLLSAPVVISKNGRKAGIEVAREFSIPDVAEEVGEEALNLGVVSHFIPVVEEQGSVIDLNLFAQVVEFNGFVGATESREAARFGCVTLTERIKVPTGATALLGGVVRENDTLVEEKVLLLGDIPLLGKFFRESKVESNPTELIMMVTPSLISEVE